MNTNIVLFGETLTGFCQSNNANISPASCLAFVYCVIGLNFDKHPRSDVESRMMQLVDWDRQGANDMDSTIQGLCDGRFTMPIDGIEDEQEGLRIMASELSTTLDRSVFHFLELVGSSQASKMKLENVSSYMESQDMHVRCNGLLLKTITYFGVRLGKLLSSEDIHELGQDNTWILYRNRTFAAAGLALQLYDSHPEEAEEAFAMSRATMQMIALNSDNLALSQLITRKGKVLLYAYLSANKNLPDNWYQGEKAWAATPAGERSAALAVFEAEYRRMRETEIDQDAGVGTNLRRLGLLGKSDQAESIQAQLDQLIASGAVSQSSHDFTFTEWKDDDDESGTDSDGGDGMGLPIPRRRPTQRSEFDGGEEKMRAPEMRQAKGSGPSWYNRDDALSDDDFKDYLTGQVFDWDTNVDVTGSALGFADDLSAELQAVILSAFKDMSLENHKEGKGLYGPRSDAVISNPILDQNELAVAELRAGLLDANSDALTSMKNLDLIKFMKLRLKGVMNLSHPEANLDELDKVRKGTYICIHPQSLDTRWKLVATTEENIDFTVNREAGRSKIPASLVIYYHEPETMARFIQSFL